MLLSPPLPSPPSAPHAPAHSYALMCTKTKMLGPRLLFFLCRPSCPPSVQDTGTIFISTQGKGDGPGKEDSCAGFAPHSVFLSPSYRSERAERSGSEAEGNQGAWDTGAKGRKCCWEEVGGGSCCRGGRSSLSTWQRGGAHQDRNQGFYLVLGPPFHDHAVS